MSAEPEILQAMYQQPNSGQITRSAEEQRYVEIWKGPWSELRKYTSTSRIFNTEFKIGSPRPTLSTPNWISCYAVPATPTKTSWMVTDIQIDQIQPAGDHGTLTITYSNRYSGGEEGDTPEPIADSEEWQVTWGTTSRSPLEYAEDMTDCRAQDIIDCKKGKHPTTGEDKEYSWYVPDPAYPGSLAINTLASDKAKLIYNYYNSGVQPMFHYPILKHTIKYQGTSDFGNLGDGIDEPGVPSGMPFSFSSDWSWLYVGDNITVTQQGDNKTYTRVEEWIGAKHIDSHFYGANAWEPTQYDNNNAN